MSTDPTKAIQALRRAVSEIDKEQPLSEVQTLEHMVDHSIAQRRFNTVLLSSFAGLGIFLALVGVYGLISYIVSSQRREIGIRCTLGAQPRHIFSGLILQILPFVSGGILIGLLVSFISRNLVATLLFGISPLDPLTYLCLPIALLSLALLVCLRAAWRASRMEPANLVRCE
jgi:ABC-type antimicrobial peptide transport system permease subunit